MNKLLDHLSLFENLISLPSDQLLANLAPCIELFTSVGRFIIITLFLIHLTAKLVTKSYEYFLKTLLPDIYILAILMVFFGNYTVYNQICTIGINIFNFLTGHILQPEFTMFKGSFRSFIDTLAEQSKQGVDFFNVKAMAASSLTLFLSVTISLLLVTYYVFVSVGMFELIVVLAIGPIIAGFYFFLKRPFVNWFTAILATLTFPVSTSIAVAIMNQADLFVNMQQHLITGSLVTCLLQILLGIAFMQVVIIFHAAIWGVSFINLPVKIITLGQLVFGMAHSAWLNIGMIIATKRKAN